MSQWSSSGAEDLKDSWNSASLQSPLESEEAGSTIGGGMPQQQDELTSGRRQAESESPLLPHLFIPATYQR